MLATGGSRMADKPHITPEGYVAVLVQVGVWATPQNPIQYAFLEKRPSYLPNEAGWMPLSSVQRAAVQTAFAVIAEIVNLTFVQVADNQQQPGTANSRIAFYANNVELSYSGSMYAYQLDGSPAIYGADIRFNTTRIAQRQTNEGFADFMPFVALHEVLHSVGLSHPGDYNGQGYNYKDHAAFVEDTIQYSVMSYFSAASSGADHTLGNVLYAARTPLLYDILALQSLYAPNMSTRAGDTIYGFNSNTGGTSPFNFAVTPGPVVAIWDGGGTDTLDLSGYADPSRISLVAGEFSDAGGLTKNIAIAFGVTIENAVGGAGDVVIKGNQAANRLEGGAGNDILAGGDGADLLIGGAGADQLEGGAGADRFLYAAAAHSAAAAIDAITDFEVGIDKIDLAQIDTGTEAGDQDFVWIGTAAFSGKGTAAQLRVVNLGGGQWRVEGDLDGNGIADFAITVTTIGGQALTAGDFAGVTVIPEPVYIGDDTDNVINGSAGHDSLEGRGGNDTLNGNAGNDMLDGSTGADRMAGGTGNDIYIVDN